MSGHPSLQVPESLLDLARGKAPLRTAIVCADTVLAIESARLATEERLIEPVFVGRLDDILRSAGVVGWDIHRYQIVAALDASHAASQSVGLASAGQVDALMKGHIHTDDLIRAVLAPRAGLRTGRRLSHVFHMTMPGKRRPFCITDAAINILPSVPEKIDIAKNARDLMHALGSAVPAIAVLSGVETVTPRMQSSIEADELTRLAAGGAITAAHVFGPLSFDTAVSQDAARIKDVTNSVAGNADVLLVPNLESGNFLFKAMVHFMGATGAGIVLGAKVPIMLTSRADPSLARVASAALALVYARYQTEK